MLISASSGRRLRPVRSAARTPPRPSASSAVNPIRVQLSRRRGYRMPANTMSVARGSRWGNPFRVESIERAIWELARAPSSIAMLDLHIALECRVSRTFPSRELLGAIAVKLFAEFVNAWRAARPDQFEAWIAPLRGKNLACYCPSGRPCHADILLALANEKQPQIHTDAHR